MNVPLSQSQNLRGFKPGGRACYIKNSRTAIATQAVNKIAARRQRVAIAAAGETVHGCISVLGICVNRQVTFRQHQDYRETLGVELLLSFRAHGRSGLGGGLVEKTAYALYIVQECRVGAPYLADSMLTVDCQLQL
jgi:hypothetical protein